MNTSCKDCMFANIAEHKESCEFGIIEEIQNDHHVEVIDGYNYIKDYTCKYGLSRSTYDQYLQHLSNEDTKKTIVNKAIIQYTLFIDTSSDNQDIDYLDLCQDINKLSITPNYIIFLGWELSPIDLSTLKNTINPNVRWKFLTSADKESSDMNMWSIFQTNKNNIGAYIWINKANNLKDRVEKDMIRNINHLIMVKQPICNFLRSAVSAGSNSDSLFMTKENYIGITKNIDKSIGIGICGMGETIIKYYD